MMFAKDIGKFLLWTAHVGNRSCDCSELFKWAVRKRLFDIISRVCYFILHIWGGWGGVTVG